MLIELYMLLEVVALVCFAVGFFRKNEWFWAIAMVLTGTLFFASYNIEQSVSVVSNQTQIGSTIIYGHEIITQPVQDQAYSYFNLGLFGVAFVLFIYDVFMNFKDKQSGKRE